MPQRDLQSDFEINFDKSCILPTKCVTYLGIELDLENRKIKLTRTMFDKLSRALNFAAGPALLAQKFLAKLGGLVNFVCSAIGLPSVWTQLALSESARACELNHALPREWVDFCKKSPPRGRTVWTNASLQDMATLEGLQVHFINCPDPRLSINDREYLAALLGFARVPCSLFIDNMSAI